jgi:hypothetical protein
MTPAKLDVLPSEKVSEMAEKLEAKEKERQEIMKEIERLEAELAEVKGTKCEVYSRIVGYFRPIKEWNVGQQSQYHDRKTFDVSHVGENKHDGEQQR